MKTVLVTGGAGFIGSHLCQASLEEGEKVICLDNLLTGSLKNVGELKDSSRFSFIKADVCQPPRIKDGLDFVFNLASPASPVDYQRFPVKTLLTNSLGVKDVLDLVVKNKARFLHTSTSEIYGEPAVHPQTEDYWGNVDPTGARSCYHESKRFAESLIVNYGKKYGLETKIVRIFNTYGPKMKPDDGRVVSNFIVQALKGKPLTVYGDGSQTRSFCFVGDMVRGLLKMADSGESGPVNLGNPEERTILDLAKKVLEKTNSSSKIEFKPLPKDDPTRRRPDISLARRQLDWEPKVSLDQGLGQTIACFKQLLF